jgi:G3E family GTPase
MRLVQVAGYLGSGKTTLILDMVKAMAQSGVKVAILVNDVGEIPVDGKVLSLSGMTVKDIGGGCVCCQMAGSLTRTLEMLGTIQKPDIVIVEPTGIAVPSSIKEAAAMASRRVKVTAGAVIALFDATRAEKLINYDAINRLVARQVRDADIVAISKVDAADPEKIAMSEAEAHKLNPAARIVRLSVKSGEGLAELVRAALGEMAPV